MESAMETSFTRNRSEEFRKLLVYVADRLDGNAVEQMEYLCDVPSESGSSGLSVLRELERRGKFSSTQTQPLIDLLREINQSQVAEHVKSDYQAKYPDGAVEHMAIARATSLPPGSSPRPANGMRAKRSNTTNDIKIVISGPDQKHLPTMEGEKSTILTSTADENHYSDGGVSVRPQPNGQITPHMVDAPPENLAVDDREITIRESGYDKAMNEADNGTAKENRCGSTSSVIIINNYMSSPHPSPTKSGSCGSIKGEIPAPPSTQCDEHLDSLDRDTKREESGAIMMKPITNDLETRPLHQPPVTRTSEASSAAQRNDSSWKRGERLSLKMAQSKGKAQGSRPWSTQNTWGLKRENLLRPIWDHQSLNNIKIPQQITIDVESGDHNPYLSLFVYPFGLFEDKNKSMTLVVKVSIPDECPPIPSKATFDLRWGVSIAAKEEAKTLEDSKRPVKIKFKTGVKYIHKLLPHKTLQQNMCERLELRVYISTTYSTNHTYT